MSRPSSPKPCPICDKPADPEHIPFCSKRCKDIDLNRWLSDGYAIPGDPEFDDGDGGQSGDGPDLSGDADPFETTRH